MTMIKTPEQLQELADYYETTDTAGAMEDGQWVNEPAVEPMVTTSLRLPLDLMQTIRQQAAAERVRPTALMRRWLEEGARGDTPAGLQFRLAEVGDDVRRILRVVQGPGAGLRGGAKKGAASRRASTKVTAANKVTTKTAAAKKATTKTAATDKSTGKQQPARLAPAARSSATRQASIRKDGPQRRTEPH